MPTISLPSKPGADLYYEYTESNSSDILAVFINGLALPAMGWKPVLGLLKTKPSTLTYDRYGQGATSARDPRDTAEGKTGPFGHTYQDVVADLHELIQTVAPEKSHKLLLVANSIGVNIARLYAQEHSKVVFGALFLDSNVANKEFHDIWPNPSDAGFSASAIEDDDVTVEQYTEICKKLPGMFNSNVPSPEGLDRRQQGQLLSKADEPKLLGPDGNGIHIVVAKHDSKVFAGQSLAMMKVPVSLTMKLTEPTWTSYHEDLTKLSPKSSGLMIATGAGHFIQKDQPQWVADQVDELVEKIGSA